LPTPAGLVDFSKTHAIKAWKDIWGSGQGVGACKEVLSVQALVERWRLEYCQAQTKILSNH
jgi:nitronate monooxygenase